ncbi:DUF2283 domain-containing protein [Nocardioides sp. SYSU DS0663]|uniref:DUF2283 domain-containing protein n=1 Tax=Nocardioides sp. SYSU DS0663 TaxID=3416445 RepID=UPI003F4B82EB
MSIAIEVDAALHAAYIRLSDDEVARTVEFSDLIMVDLNEFGVAVGIELLDEGAVLPFTELVNDFHVHSDVVEILRLIRPSVSSYLKLTQGNDGTSEVRSAAVV